MELISKDAVLKIIKSGSKLNDTVRILTRDIVQKVNDLPVLEIDEEEEKDGH